MSNEVMIPEASNLPAHIKAALEANPSLLQANRDAAAGIGGGAVPTLTAYNGMFKTKIDGVEEIIQMKTEMGMINAPKIVAVILAGKVALDRAWFATAYTGAGTEPVSPDCSSEDGIKPKADSPNKQCESCAGCPQNMWGSAKKSDGTPGKGKACAEKKRLAVFANNNIFRFNVPPATLGDFAVYARQLEGYGRPLATVATTIAFDPAEPTKLVFGYHGDLPAAAWEKLQPQIDGEKVRAIMQNFSAPVQQLAEKPATPTGPTAAEVKAAEEKAAAEKKAADKKAADKKAADKKAADKKAADEKAAADKAAAASAGSADLGLGIDLGMGDAGADLSLNLAGEGNIPDELTDDALADLFAV